MDRSRHSSRRKFHPASAGGRVTSGIGLVSMLIGLERELDAADLVITGEGSFDHQSLRGKVVAGIANGARDRGLPCIVVDYGGPGGLIFPSLGVKVPLGTKEQLAESFRREMEALFARS